MTRTGRRAAGLWVAIGLLLATGVRAQLLGMDGGEGAEPRPQRPRAGGTAGREYAPPRPFVIGRDNLGFANLYGAVQIQGAAGNCYTMAAVAKLFYEAARYGAPVPAGATLGFEFGEVAAALRDPSYPGAGFPVRGSASLHELSLPRAGAAADPEAWMEAQSRYQTGLQAAPAPGEVPPNGASLVKLYQLVTTIHYLHYMQYQGQNFVTAVMRRQLQGDRAAPQVTREALGRMKRMLPRGDLPLLTIFNPRPGVTFGHVVLATRLVDVEAGEGAPAHTDVYVYDSNAQYGDHDYQSVLRVKEDGTFELLREREGTFEHDARYDGADWFNEPANCQLLVLDDLNRDPALRRVLAEKVENAAEAAAYTQLSGDLLRDLTTRSPSDSPLRADLTRFLLAAQRSNARLGTRPTWRTRDLTEAPSVEELNAYLDDYADRTIRELFPHALPEGLALSGTRLRLDPTDANHAWLWVTITLEPAAPIQRILDAVRESLLLGSDPRLAATIEGLGTAFQGQRVVASLRLSLRKGPAPEGVRAKLGPYAPVPTLDGSHVVVGDIQPGTYDPEVSDHRIEVSESLLRSALVRVLRAQGAFATINAGTYQVGWATHNASDFTLQGAGLDCQRGTLVVTGSFGGFLAFNPFWNDYGSAYQSRDPLAARLSITKGRGRNVFRFAGSAATTVSFRDPVTGLLVDHVTAAANQSLGASLAQLQAGAGNLVTTQLGRWASFANGTSIGFGTPTLSSSNGDLSVAIPVNGFDLDVGATLTTLFGQRAPMEVKDLRILADRIVVLTENDG